MYRSLALHQSVDRKNFIQNIKHDRIMVGSLHRSAVRCANALLSWLNRRQLLSFGNSVSSWGLRVIIVGGGNDAVRVLAGYMPSKLSCSDSSALARGVDLR